MRVRGEFSYRADFDKYVVRSAYRFGESERERERFRLEDLELRVLDAIGDTSRRVVNGERDLLQLVRVGDDRELLLLYCTGEGDRLRRRVRLLVLSGDSLPRRLSFVFIMDNGESVTSVSYK